MTKLSPLANTAPLPPNTSAAVQKEGGDGKSTSAAPAQKLSSKKIQQITLSQHVQHLIEKKQEAAEVLQPNQNQSTFVSLPSADEIDAAVMAELPPSLQQEIAEAYAALTEPKAAAPTVASKPAKVTRSYSISKDI